MSTTTYHARKIISLYTHNKARLESYCKCFFDVLVRVEEKTGTKLEELEECKAPQIGEWFQLFWEELPDSPKIRRLGFYELCDISEVYAESTSHIDGVHE